jgi:hypothetical protein
MPQRQRRQRKRTLLPKSLPVGPYDESQLWALPYGTEMDALTMGYSRQMALPDPARIAQAYKRGYETAADIANERLVDDSKNAWAVFDYDPTKGAGVGRTVTERVLNTKYSAEMKTAGLNGSNFHHVYDVMVEKAGFPLQNYNKANRANAPIAIPLDKAPSLLVDIGPVRIANVAKLRSILTANAAQIQTKGLLVPRH